ncbi:hypothetical protein LCGC14_1540150, partial [marine sediment metagenome]
IESTDYTEKTDYTDKTEKLVDCFFCFYLNQSVKPAYRSFDPEALDGQAGPKAES